MQSTSLVAVIGILSAVFSMAAQAQTGRPSTVEVPAAADTPRIVAPDQELGAYGRYLMLNAATRDAAIVAARNVDHPAPRKVLASGARADARPTPRQ